MSTVPIEPLLHRCSLRRNNSTVYRRPRGFSPFSLNLRCHFTSKKLRSVGSGDSFGFRRSSVAIRASSSDTAVVEASQSDDVIFKEKFLVQRIEKSMGRESDDKELSPQS